MDFGNAQRKQLERNMTFGGLLVFGNELKPETKEVINELLSAKIDILVATGDHLTNAVYVCFESGIATPEKRVFISEDHFAQMVKKDSKLNLKNSSSSLGSSTNSVIELNDSNNGVQIDGLEKEARWVEIRNIDSLATFEPNKTPTFALSEIVNDENCFLAMSGKEFDRFRRLDSETMGGITFDLIMKRTRAFARVSPVQKQQIVEYFMSQKLYVAMCGDGNI